MENAQVGQVATFDGHDYTVKEILYKTFHYAIVKFEEKEGICFLFDPKVGKEEMNRIMSELGFPEAE